jgi:rubrerythrin
MTANFRELLEKAIAIEARMAEFYGAMAEKATNPEHREILKILVGEENEHRFSLGNYLEIGIFPQTPKIRESDLDDTLKVVGSITPEMAPTDALAFAIRSEECQHKFYEKLSMEYPSGLVHNFLKRMADMELVHKERVEKLLR